MSYSGPNPRVAFQGEHGAFSEDAAIKLLGPAIELVPRRTFAALFSSVDEGLADFVLAPVENTIAGAVKPTIELLRKSELVVAEEVIIRIEQQLTGCAGAVFDEIEAVESHPVALAQCQKFFGDNPQIMRIESDDTAGSVARIIRGGDRKRAAIASRRAAEIYGGSIIRENVEDDSENYTRFLLLTVRRKGQAITESSNGAKTLRLSNKTLAISQVRKEACPRSLVVNSGHENNLAPPATSRGHVLHLFQGCECGTKSGASPPSQPESFSRPWSGRNLED